VCWDAPRKGAGFAVVVVLDALTIAFAPDGLVLLVPLVCGYLWMRTNDDGGTAPAGPPAPEPA
jgi:hypothetical protein